MADARWLDDAELGAWLGLITSTALLDVALDRQLQRDSGISHSHYQILAILSQAPGGAVHMSELAINTSSSLSRMSHAVARLERLGAVTRSPCPENRRAVHATLTEAGRRVIERAAPGHVSEVRRLVFDHLSKSQVQQLKAITIALTTALSAEGFEIPAPLRDAGPR
jgi:DNA-binding MarR family transcriptional regulator